ncbi:hypothetical protein PGT21_012710 [Puccinia graminis f. sp. tritici]|uniref:Uncharacterized protein n=1 Tax=Puccinia graminis f. sp. tritici TaxID=56615 RepID=A0A5B0MB70_PUCGR|nr:hypothetical protein PGT21_012710 [Puccinia graminis f. sp. tritici]
MSFLKRYQPSYVALYQVQQLIVWKRQIEPNKLQKQSIPPSHLNIRKMRRKVWTSVIWIISCLGASENFQKVIAIDDVNDLSRTSEAKRISDSSGDSTTIREELGSRKRTRVILLGSGSGSSPREGRYKFPNPMF